MFDGDNKSEFSVVDRYQGVKKELNYVPNIVRSYKQCKQFFRMNESEGKFG